MAVDSSPRDVVALVVPAWGSVISAPHVCWVVVDDAGIQVSPVYKFMIELAAAGCSPSTRRSYCYDLLRWWRFCLAVDVPWQAAGREEVRDFVRWLQVKDNPQRHRRAPAGVTRPPAGTINAATGKTYLKAGYAARTINHALSVLSAFYAFAYENGLGTSWNPVPGGKSTRRDGSTLPRRARYRQKMPVFQPRSVPEDLLQRLFEALEYDRDRALVAVALSSGARAGELLSMTVAGVDAGQGVLAIEPKGGLGSRVWIPAAPESFVWIARYLASRPQAPLPGEPLWLGLRAPSRPLTYFGLRQDLERANAKLGTNLSWHDFRHTFSHRILADEAMTLSDAQALMRHRSLATLETYATARLDELVSALHRHLAKPAPPEPTPGPGFAAEDLGVLFPGMTL